MEELLAIRTDTELVEIVVPVHNEAQTLEATIARLREYLDRCFPFPAVVTIADNASIDGTDALARALAARRDGVQALHLDEKGRGRALRTSWTASRAEVVAYMDADLATGLEALLPLVAPLLSGHSDIAIGSRLAGGAHVVRGPRRELISRCYNVLLRVTLGSHFSDAQCGFKAMRADAGSAPVAPGRGQRLVLRHRAPGPRRTQRPAHPRGSGRLGRRSRLPGGHRAHLPR